MSGQRQTSRLLINEAPLQVLPSLAAAIGLNEAIVLQQIHFLLGSHESIYEDDQRWIHRTMSEWTAQFSWWNTKTVQRTFTNLRKLKLVLTANHNLNKWDHTLSYRIDYDALEALSIGHVVTVDVDKKSNSEEDKKSTSDIDKSGQSSLLENRDKEDSLGTKVPDAPKSTRKPDPVFDWVAANIFKVTPESAHEEPDTCKWIGANTAKLVNAEKLQLNIPNKKPLTDEQRVCLAAQLPGLLKYYNQQSPGLTPPKAKPKFGLLVKQWYDAGKPFAAPIQEVKYIAIEPDEYVSPSEAA